MQHAVSQHAADPEFMAQATLPDLVQATLAGLNHTRRFTTGETLHQLGVDLRTVPHAAPEQDQFIIVRTDFGTDVGNQATGVDTLVDVVQRTADLPGFPVVKLSLIHISEPTRQESRSRMPTSA